jgi:septal ring factor EnvC (AmiA/AmiB activator)
VPARERRFPSLRAETGAALERELLLVDTPGEESVPPRLRRRLGVLAAGAVLLALAVTAVVFFVQVRGHWRDQLGTAQAELERARKEHGEREAGWKREAAGLTREIEERKAENRSLSQIADKTLVELKTALDDLRRSHEENQKLAAELRDALAGRSGGLVEILKRYSSLLVPPAPTGDSPGAR